ncbi:ATP-binding protein [Effusibacillus consociatus]|uniref:histidine kinase n=1 Tax=Effusibacillus consociatus TaxID=1117041 RepID=A0ABV9PW72_9BACL
MSDYTRYSRLATITQLINSNLDLRSVLEHVVTAISEEIVQCDLVGIFLPQEDGAFRGFVGKPEQANGLTVDQIIIDPAHDLLAQEIIQTKQSIYIPDTSKDRRPNRRSVEMLHIQSMLGLPIAYEDELFGLIFLHDYGTPMNLTSDEIQSVEAYVNMAAVAIRNAKLLSRQQSLLAEKQLLLDATRELALCSTTQEVLDTSFRYVGVALGNHNIGVHLCDAMGKKFRPARMHHHSEWTEKEWKKVHNQVQLDFEKDLLFQEVVRTKQAVLIPDVNLDPRPNHEACRTFGIKGIFMLPLVATGEILGTMAVVSLGEVRTYSEASQLLAQSIVDATATALANVIRMEQLELIIKARTAELHEKNGMLEQVVSELKSLDQMKNDFIASMSHELRTPMTAIKGSVELLKSGVMGSLNPEQMELVDMAEQGIIRLLNKVNDILDFSKLKDGTFLIHKTKTDYQELIRRTVDIVTPLFTKKSQRLSVNVQQMPPIEIDPDRIEQVLLNLLGNASKFTPKYGKITIHAELVDEGVLTTIEDTGIGIPSSCLDKIFDRFYQVKHEKIRNTSGTGLGLSIAKQIVELHGGEMWAESVLNSGSRFYFLLPL